MLVAVVEEERLELLEAVEAVVEVLEGRLAPAQAMAALMARHARSEGAAR
jgi:anthranilate phosphoribosyltransferase